MATPILATKLFAPRLRQAIVLRPRLIERLNHSLTRDCKLSLIAAPAGFGKTTLLSEWLAGCDRPVAWLSLDAADNEPQRFVSYVLAAIQTARPGIGTNVLNALQSAQAPSVDTALTSLINDIAAGADNLVLVLDDYHVIDNPAVNAAVAFLLDHLPSQLHLVMATREDPHLSLARLRAQGRLTELRATDLRFTPAEAADFLNRVMGLKLTDTDVAALDARTEGWIAGLQMAAISMQGHHDTAGLIRSLTGSHRFVLDYLIEEVLQRQPANIQTFLLRTSILDRMCGSLCDAVLGDAALPGQAFLEQLEAANLFIIPLDNERRWYRYHHLFRDLLRQRLNQPRDLPDYHLRASAWFEAHADFAQAFQHALAAGDAARAAQLCEMAWPDMVRSFQATTWLSWVTQLPESVILPRPSLCINIASAYADRGDSTHSEAYLRRAETTLDSIAVPEAAASLFANIAQIHASNAQNDGNLSDTVRYAEQALRLAPEGDAYLRSQAAITLGFTHWTAGNVGTSLQAMRAWMVDMNRLGNHLFMIASAFAVADMLVIMGRLGDAHSALIETIEQAAAHGPAAESITAHHHLGLAMLAHERGEDAAFVQEWQAAERLGASTTLVDWAYRWALVQARLKASDGDWDAALSLLDVAQRAYVKHPIPIVQPISARKARIHLKQGRLDKAQAWARERGLALTDDVSYMAEHEHLTLARVRMAEGSAADVHDLLDRLLVLAESQQRMGGVVEIQLTKAIAYQTEGALPHAFAALERALMLTAPEGWIRVFVDEGAVMHALLSAYRVAMPAGNALLRDHVENILARYPQSAAAARQSQPAPLVPGLFERLTEREIEILRLIAAGRSNAEIGQHLYLALSTVKGHNLRLFGKLQAQNRTEAVARARELGLL